MQASQMSCLYQSARLSHMKMKEGSVTVSREKRNVRFGRVLLFWGQRYGDSGGKIGK